MPEESLQSNELKQLRDKLSLISRSIEKWCMDSHPDNIGTEELSPALETTYNIAIGDLDKSIGAMLKELDTWDKYKKIKLCKHGLEICPCGRGHRSKKDGKCGHCREN